MLDLADTPDAGRLAQNITHFARALRRAGLPIGPARVISAIKAVEAVGFTERMDFYYTLRACFVSRPEQLQLFNQTFRLYWRDPQFLEHMMRMLSPTMQSDKRRDKPQDAEKRAAEALLDAPDLPEPETVPDEPEDVQLSAELTFSADEKLRAMDFEQMTLAEMAEARGAIARIQLPVRPIVSRRTQPHARGKVTDWQATMRAAMRTGGEAQALRWRARRTRWPNLVALCDISGSMSGYSRMLLHFLHAASNAKGAGWARVHSFTFGTELTNVTRHMANRDVDTALQAAGAEARDWEGGTRIGASLRAFNRVWSRRVLGQGAVVLLITDGLDRDGGAELAREAERLRLSCRKLIWLNPLLRWEGFAPKAQGIRALLPQVDAFRAAHNIASLDLLADALTRADDAGDKARLMKMLQD